MRAASAEVAARKPTVRSCVSNGRDILPDVDGRSEPTSSWRSQSRASFEILCLILRTYTIRVPAKRASTKFI
jgi:hypothetical protein